MTDHFHNICDLICSNNTPPLAFCADVLGHPVLICLEDRSLVQTNDRGVDVHIAEDNVGVGKSCW